TVPSPHLPSPGDIAQVRHRQYLVDEVHRPKDVREEHTLVRLTCLDDDAQGRPLSVLWERELGAKVIRPSQTGLGEPARLDEPRHFAAYLHALKWNSVTAAPSVSAGMHVDMSGIAARLLERHALTRSGPQREVRTDHCISRPRRRHRRKFHHDLRAPLGWIRECQAATP